MSDPTSYHDHTQVIEDVLNIPHHDNKPVLRCERCGCMVDRDTPDAFAAWDCDQSPTVRDDVTRKRTLDMQEILDEGKIMLVQEV
jgi:hypothetical protein